MEPEQKEIDQCVQDIKLRIKRHNHAVAVAFQQRGYKHDNMRDAQLEIFLLDKAEIFEDNKTTIDKELRWQGLPKIDGVDGRIDVLKFFDNIFLLENPRRGYHKNHRYWRMRIEKMYRKTKQQQEQNMLEYMALMKKMEKKKSYIKQRQAVRREVKRPNAKTDKLLTKHLLIWIEEELYSKPENQVLHESARDRTIQLNNGINGTSLRHYEEVLSKLGVTKKCSRTL